MGSNFVIKKSRWIYVLCFSLVLKVATVAEGQRIVTSLGSRLKRIGGRSQKEVKGKYPVSEGKYRSGRGKARFYMRTPEASGFARSLITLYSRLGDLFSIHRRPQNDRRVSPQTCEVRTVALERQILVPKLSPPVHRIVVSSWTQSCQHLFLHSQQMKLLSM